jgi:hypothetical protein
MTPRCGSCGELHGLLITFTLAELLLLTDEELDQLEELRGDFCRVCREAAWWRRWRERRRSPEAA